MENISKEGLTRGIRRWDLVAIAINAIIGAGIFGLPAKVFSLIGAYSIVAFAVCALVVALIVLCFAEVGSRFDATGGPYLYAREAFGPTVGFEVGWLLWLVRVTAFAANCNLLVQYASYFWPPVGSGAWRAALITGVVLLLTVVNLLGVRETTLVSNLFTIGKLIPLLILVAVGLFFIAPENYSFDALPDYSAFSTSVLLLIYAFTGFEMAVIPAGEARHPQRDIPFAVLVAIAIVAVLFILIQTVCIGTLPELAESERPLADAGSRFLGAAGGALISAGAITSIIGNLNVVLLAGSRMPFAMAERDQLPRVLAATHHRFRTPHVSILVTATVVLALTLSGTFIYALTVSAITRLVIYAATCAALPVFRQREDELRTSGFRAPAGTLVTALALGLILWLLANSTWREARDATIAALLGLLIYFIHRKVRRTRRDSHSQSDGGESTSSSAKR
ncbi:MAG: APC family permease [Pyrinomonas sp.]|uniref:APC family permease n=1 Tax=Pyrinomonas sp. TaxID=2080306 RepID=UPI00331D794A